MVDLSVYDKLRTVSDYQKENAESAMKRQLLQAEVSKAKMLDVDKLGEIAFMKDAMGQQLTPQEIAAAQFVDAKSGGIMINPVTGVFQQKPRISDKMGLPGMGGRVQAGGGYEPRGSGGGGGSTAPMPLPADAFDGMEVPQPLNEFDLRFQEQLDKARGNPKLQQSIREAYAKEKTKFDESQAKAAGFADRTRTAEGIFGDEKVVKAGMNPMQRISGATPLIGNYLTNPDYQQFDQAQRDFVNAVLRRESGAVISDEEFKNARLQYHPQPGDSKQVLAQKKINRENAIAGLQTSAGAAYNPSLYERGEAEFNAKKKTINWEDLP